MGNGILYVGSFSEEFLVACRPRNEFNIGGVSRPYTIRIAEPTRDGDGSTIQTMIHQTSLNLARISAKAPK